MFRVTAKNIFLTYPQANDISHQDLFDHLFTLADNVYSCIEQHSSNGVHFHAICSWVSKKDIRNERYFDFGGHHPNIAGCRDLRRSIQYIEKDGQTLGRAPTDLRSDRQSRLKTLLDESQTYEDFIRGFEEVDAHSSIIHHEAIGSYAAKRFRRELHYTPRDRSTFTVPQALNDWVTCNLFPQIERPKCLILYGGTRLGKTEWARSLGEHSYWNNYVTVEGRNINARYAVIDDMESFDRFNGAKSFFGCQKVVGFNPKYSKLQQWSWGIPTIWLFNELPLGITFPDNNYYVQNSVIIKIDNPLYK